MRARPRWLGPHVGILSLRAPPASAERPFCGPSFRPSGPSRATDARRAVNAAETPLHAADSFCLLRTQLPALVQQWRATR